MSLETQVNSQHNGVSPDDIRAWDNEHFVHPWNGVGGENPDRTIVSRGEGIHLIGPDGKRYIDGPGGMWCVQIGYGNQEMADAIAAQALALPYFNPFGMAAEPASVLSKKLAEFAPGDLNRVFLTNGGSEAVDTALRFVHFYNNIKGRPEKKLIIARERGYHGSTYLAASVSGKARDKSFMDTADDLVRFLPDVNPYVRPKDMSVEDWCDAKIADLESAILEAGADKVAAFIAEPLLASGGVIVPPPGYHKRCLETCRKHDVLYISDEVVTGFGRLGHWFASDPVFDIVPDIITCAKGLTSGYQPLGAAIISDRLMNDIGDQEEDYIATFSNGFTYSGHPICCAAALKNIEIMERDGLLEHVRNLTPHFQERLNDLVRHDIIGNARGMGLVGCVEGIAAPDLPEEKRLAIDSDFGYRVDAKCEEMGLIVRPIFNLCVFSPPLIIKKDEVDQLFDILDKAIQEVQSEMM